MPAAGATVAGLRVLIALVWAFALSGPLVAEPRSISGSDDAAYVQAVNDWLQGTDDLAALQSLSDLAQGGNTAAQILLASIASRGHMHVHVTKDLPRKERVALLRMPGGLSGKSWLAAAETTEPLATALLQVAQVSEKWPAIMALLSYGETAEALLAARSRMMQGETAQMLQAFQDFEADIPDEATFLLMQELVFQAMATGGQRYVGSARIGSMLTRSEAAAPARLVWETVAFGPLIFDPDYRASVVKNVDAVPSWTPIRRFCEMACGGEEAAMCTAFGAGLNAQGPFATRGPREALLPNEAYWASPRMTGDLARQSWPLENISEKTRAAATELSPCFMRAMAEAQVRHGAAQ